ncbi:MAG: hypothetical protein GY924_22925 [Planctomycetaceae bacterium]|nr:hypothetical protein [Planctomycetaceae bacterium]
MPFDNDADNPAEAILMNDEQKHRLIALMAQALSTVLNPYPGDDDEPA